MIAITLLISYRKGVTVSCKKKNVLNLKYNQFRVDKEDFVNGFKRRYDLLVEMCIYSNYDIPYETQLILLAVIYTILGNDLFNASAKEKIKQ